MEETFTRESPTKVVSSLGYSVETLGRTGIQYIDATHNVGLSAEGLMINAYSLYTSSIPGDGDEKARILANVQKAFAFSRVGLQII